MTPCPNHVGVYTTSGGPCSRCRQAERASGHPYLDPGADTGVVGTLPHYRRCAGCGEPRLLHDDYVPEQPSVRPVAAPRPARASTWTITQRAEVLEAIRTVARTRTEFTADDVWRELAGRVPVTKGLAAVLTRAAALGDIVNSGRTTVAARGGQHDHAQRLTVWQSRMYGRGAA